MIVTDHSIKDVNKWALTQRLKEDRFFTMEIGAVTWYVDNYCARAVPTACAYIRTEAAPDGVARKLAARLSAEEMPLTDTGQMRSNGKRMVCIFRTVDGVEIGVRDDHAKLTGKAGQIYATVSSPEESLLVARVGTTAVAMFPQVKIPEVKA